MHRYIIFFFSEIYMANEATKKDIVVPVEIPPEEIVLAPQISEV